MDDTEIQESGGGFGGEAATQPGHLSSAEDHNHLEPPQLDLDRYRGRLADADLSPDQVDELLRLLWQMMCAVVDISHGLESVQWIFGSTIANSFAEECTASTVNEVVDEPSRLSKQNEEKETTTNERKHQ